jgi:hypothetical protein
MRHERHCIQNPSGCVNFCPATSYFFGLIGFNRSMGLTPNGTANS